MTSAVVEIRINARISLVGEIGAVRTCVGGIGVAVVSAASGHAAGGTVLASVTVDEGIGLVCEVGVVRAGGGCAGAITTGASAVASGASASSSAVASGASAGASASASCRVCSAVV